MNPTRSCRGLHSTLLVGWVPLHSMSSSGDAAQSGQHSSDQSAHLSQPGKAAGSEAALAAAIRTVEAAAGDPRPGLSLDIFLFLTRMMPVFTVDLWITDKAGRVLLTWRDDPYFGQGWHVPGSVVRFQERIEHRLHVCAEDELGARIEYDPTPMTLVEEIQEGVRLRGHNVSAAYRCRLLTPPDPARAYPADPLAPSANAPRPKPDQWAWFSRCPDNLLAVHRVYERFFPGTPDAEHSVPR